MTRFIAKLLYLLACTVLCAGCAPDRLRTQGLQIGAGSLASVKDPLLVLAVHVAPVQANLKLRGLVVRDLATNEPYVFSFFDNVVLGSRAIPHTIVENSVRQLALLELPRGKYAIAKIDLALRSDAKSLVFQELEAPIDFVVANDRVTYLGRLSIDITGVTVSGLTTPTTTYTFPVDSTINIYTTVQNVVAHWSLAVSSAASEDLAIARSRYPALANQDIAQGSMRVRPRP